MIHVPTQELHHQSAAYTRGGCGRGEGGGFFSEGYWRRREKAVAGALALVGANDHGRGGMAGVKTWG